MKTLNLYPNQIITLNDFPIYSMPDLEKYYKISKFKLNLPFVPVIKKDIVKKYFDNKLLDILKQFEQDNPEAKYFMLDGSHRTTALTLTKSMINVVIYEIDEDISEAKGMIDTGQILDSGTLYYNLKKNCEILSKHFNVRSYFMTVEQKTLKLIEEKEIPQHMKDVNTQYPFIVDKNSFLL